MGAKEYDEEDEQILRRLGKAVIQEWKSIPSDLQQKIKNTALYTLDTENRSGLMDAIEDLILAHQED